MRKRGENQAKEEKSGRKCKNHFLKVNDDKFGSFVAGQVNGLFCTSEVESNIRSACTEYSPHVASFFFFLKMYDCFHFWGGGIGEQICDIRLGQFCHYLAYVGFRLQEKYLFVTMLVCNSI